MKVLYYLSFLCLLVACNNPKNPLVSFEGSSIILQNPDTLQLRLTPYGNGMVRVQYAIRGEDFFPDNHYEMVVDHNRKGQLKLTAHKEHYLVTLSDKSAVEVDKNTLQVRYYLNKKLVLQEKEAFLQNKEVLKVSFEYDSTEHFTGLGHGYFGRAESIDLKGKRIERNYGSYHHQQAPLLVPFYLSNKGYGIFLNSTFTNYFNFGEKGHYEFGIQTSGFEGRMDYYFIAGPDFREILQQYVQLTGHPRLPPKSIFGLHLSDKGHDHNSPTPSDEQWWREKITDHRNAGFPLDHVVNDNRWRAGGGQRCESYIEWDPDRYPDPAVYKKWLDEQGLTVTLDLNRCIAQFSEGWSPEFNIPVTDSINFKESAPDLTHQGFRKWFWNIFYQKSLDPALAYPGDALWIDEFDEMGNAPKDMMLANGRSSAEMRNYWFFLIAKALVEEGWDKSIGVQKRPYVWVRGMTAGAQRYATLWSGDIKPTFEDMRSQIRGMQLAGLSGFPYWGHDAGGFYDWERQLGPNEELYQKWSMAFGSFSPIWRPHGMGQSRWPLDRSVESQGVAKIYGELRYALMPYTYTYAYQAHKTGIPITRAMLIDYQNEEEAWKYDLQYMWGDDILVAPLCFPENNIPVWLPKGRWYDFWTDKNIIGDQVLEWTGSNENIPLFVKEGAIIPTTEGYSSTAFLEDRINLHVYTGADGQFTLYEDDGYSEGYRIENEKRETLFEYTDRIRNLQISAARGSYKGAKPERTAFYIVFHGLDEKLAVKVNEHLLTEEPTATEGYSWFDAEKKWLWVRLGNQQTTERLVVELVRK